VKSCKEGPPESSNCQPVPQKNIMEGVGRRTTAHDCLILRRMDIIS
jgi:hypothetical protein